MRIQKKTLQDLQSTVVFSRKLLFCMNQGACGTHRNSLKHQEGACSTLSSRQSPQQGRSTPGNLGVTEPEERNKAKCTQNDPIPLWECSQFLLAWFFHRENIAFLLSWGSSAMLAIVVFLHLCTVGKNINSYNWFTVLHDINIWVLHILSLLTLCFDKVCVSSCYKW